MGLAFDARHIFEPSEICNFKQETGERRGNKGGKGFTKINQ